ncbi:Salicylate hydroxylase 1 [Pleurostoma richardsiae]|uniref:Salicylate hydroxylase 1 n=1 Tax=Pleurostoma richardsiae TaxID=41990 RepID=A0AA38RKI9_9PEZI|nr:Salicylate hydroxylase 1 [Pleurostoma richardsiae]
MMETPRLSIAIIGAGIAGLAAAIALKDHPSIDIQIYERAAELKEIGASIALGPNGMRTLDRLGVQNALDDSIAFRNKSGFPMIYRHYKTNEIVSTDSHHGDVDSRHLTARYYRAHLQEALLEHVDPSLIHLSKPFRSVAFDDKAGKLVISFGDDSFATADLLLGADGIHSAVRRFFVPTSAPVWTGWVAFRSVFPISQVAHVPDLPDEAIHIWGPDRTLFLSPLGRGLFTVVASHQSDPAAPDAPYADATWDSEGADLSVLEDYYRDWSPLARGAVAAALPATRVYPNTATAEGLDTWVLGDGRVTVAGDAAHAHGGAFAAGGSLALDDAWAFAASILTVSPETATRKPSSADLSKALRLYEATRKAHTDRVLRTVHQGNRKKVERVGKLETDEQLRTRMKSREDPVWIHEHDVQAAFSKALAAQGEHGESQARL